MRGLRTLCAVAVVAAFVSVIPANAAITVHFVGAGSSAMYQGTGLAVGEIAATHFGAGTAIHHWTFKSSNCPSATCLSFVSDPRTNPGTGQIPPEASNVWVVWVCPGAQGPSEPACAAGTTTDVWVYHQIDSTVGDRVFFGRDASGTGSAGRSNVTFTGAANAANAISPALWAYGFAGTSNCGGKTTCDDDVLPSDVAAAVQNTSGTPVQITAGFTDIRAEDAKAATKRSNGPASNGVSLGYGTVGSQLIGSAIWSSFTSTAANPVEFGLQGLPDPFNNIVVPPSITVFPIGESPILFIANRGNNAGLGAVTAGGAPAFADLEDGSGPVNAGQNQLGALFSANDCSGEALAFTDGAGNQSLTTAVNPGTGTAPLPNFPITLIQREPLSGTMNTTEWSEFRTFNVCPGASCSGPVGGAYTPYALISTAYANGFTQEYNVNASVDNKGPANGLNKACNLHGTRRRAVGTGELVNTGVLATADSLGYTFFSFGNVSKLAAAGAGDGYLTIDEIDPLFANYANAGGFTHNGQLPSCTPGGAPDCSQGATGVWAGNPSFPNLRNGTYRAWSLLRMYCDTNNGHCLNTSDGLGAQAIVLKSQGDIVAGGTSSFADYLPIGEASYIRAHYQLLGGSHHALPFVHFFDQDMIDPAGTDDTLDVESSSNENGQWNGNGFANGGDAGGCIIPIDNITGGVSNNANNTVLKITKATAHTAGGIGTGSVRFTYTDVSGQTLANLAAKGLNIELSVSGFALTGQNGAVDGIYSVTPSGTNPQGGTVLATLERSATSGSIPAAGTSYTIAPTNPNASAGNGNGAAGGSNVTNSCYQ